MTTPTDKKQQVRTLGRGLVILDRLKDLGPLTLTEMATELGLDKSTILRLVNTLCDFGSDDKVIGTISITFPSKRFEENYASVGPGAPPGLYRCLQNHGRNRGFMD